MKLLFLIVTLSILQNFISAQKSELKNDSYQNGLSALSAGDTLKAIDLLKRSGDKEKNAEAYYKLAQLYSSNKSHTELTNALRAVRKATEIDGFNINYRLLMARTREELFYASKLNIEERNAAIIDYRKILEIDSTCAEANYELGRLEQENFLEFNTSVFTDVIGNLDVNSYSLQNTFDRIGLQYNGSVIANKMKDEFDLANSLKQEYSSITKEDFNETEKCLKNAIKYSPQKKESYFLLSQLYLQNDMPEEGLEILKLLYKKYALDKNVNLYLGLFYYRLKLNNEANKHFKNAVALMDYEEKQEILYNTAKILLEPTLGEKIDSMSVNELDERIKMMWLLQDPLLLTDYNERILEHFSRVAYSNLFFGVKDENAPGWKTDRGEVYVRYGQPWSIRRVRPQMSSADGRAVVVPKGELWTYPDKQFAFDDIYSTGNYRFNQYGKNGSVMSAFQVDTDEFIKEYRKEMPQEYIPKMEGPIFKTTYKIYQFNNDKNEKTQIYLSYKINYDSLLTSKDSFSEGYDLGIFFYDVYLNQMMNKREFIASSISPSKNLNTIAFALSPQPGNLAFELSRKKDKGVAAYHGKFTVKNFKTNNLELSDLVLAKNISEDFPNQNSIERNGITIVPNPSNTFNVDEKPFLYYEVYNLSKRPDKLTDFEQKISIQKKEKDNALSDVLDFIGINRSGETISTVSHYQTLEENPHVYFQLDLSKYDEGEYFINILIRDKLNKTENTTSSTIKLIR